MSNSLILAEIAKSKNAKFLISHGIHSYSKSKYSHRTSANARGMIVSS